MDAEWKLVQQKTFTRWCNEHLRHQGMTIDDLAVDLGDGLLLIALLEALSQKKMKRYNKNPKMRAQKLENIQIALNFIAYEGIKIVNIGTADVIDSNLKLILGLIWTIILHYQISMGFGLHDASESSQTPKQALLQYVNDLVRIPDRPVKNFTTDWNDGIIVSALVDAIAPGLCPEYATMEPQNALENASHSMKLADDWLGVPQSLTWPHICKNGDHLKESADSTIFLGLVTQHTRILEEQSPTTHFNVVLEPKDMVNPKVDELSMMTYVSQFPEAKLKEGAPIKASPADASKVTCKPMEVDEDIMAAWAEGVESIPDNFPLFATVDEPYVMDVNTGNAGHGKVSAQFKPIADSPEADTEVPVDVEILETGMNQYELKFTPLAPTDMDLQVFFDGFPVGDPQRVIVSNPKACQAHGPGLQSGLLANQETHFIVETKNAGPGKLACTIHDSNKEEVPFEMEAVGDSEYKVTYTPPAAGNYSVSVTYAKCQIDDSPFHFNVCDPTAVVAYGPGLEAATMNEEAEFTVDPSKAGDGQLGLAVEGPRKAAVHCNDNGDGTYKVTYTPVVAGVYKFNIKFADVDIPASPFSVRAGRPPADASKCTVQGIDSPGSFVLDASEAGGSGILEVCAHDAFMPVQSIAVTHNGDYTFNVKYHISEPGDTTINVKWHGDHIPGSPFIIHT